MMDEADDYLEEYIEKKELENDIDLIQSGILSLEDFPEYRQDEILAILNRYEE